MKKIFFLPLILLSPLAFSQPKDVITPGANLVVEGLPPIPVSIAVDVKKYTESRSASFVAWHPVKREMLITTRFGNVPQLHKVVMPMGDRKQITFYDEPVSSAIYEPVKGDYFTFNRDQGGNEFSQIYKQDAATGKTTIITDGGRSQNGGLTWNHMGTKFAYMSTRRNGTDRDIYLVDTKKNNAEKLLISLQGGGWGILDWTRDGGQLLVVEGISANEGHLWLVDVMKGTKIELTKRSETGVSYADAAFSTDGKGIWFVTDKDNEFHRLAWLEMATKRITYLTTPIPWDVEGMSMSKDGKQLAFSTNEAGLSALYLLNTATKQYKKVEGLPSGNLGGFEFHTNGKDLAMTIQSARTSADVYVLNIETNLTERWTESEMGNMVPTDLSIPTLVKWKSFDDKEISGFYYKPAAKFTGKRPVIINIHGGPEGQSRPGFIGASNYYLNELGVAIIYPNVRGSSGYGKTFLTLDNGMKREESVKDIGALIAWIATQPDLDANRIMVAGGSYGGYMSLAVSTTYADKIRCALDVVGISNFNTFLKNTEGYRRDLRRVEYGDERLPEMAAFFDKISPLNNVDKITKPLFIVQGGNDPRVPRSEAVQMAEKVKAKGGQVWYLEAKDEGHGFRKKNNTDFLLFSTIQFMKMYLLDGV